MRSFRLRQVFVFLALMLLVACAPAGPRVTIAIDPRAAGLAIPQNVLGFSYEAAQVLPRAGGAPYFSPDNKPLVALFRTIGIKSLRIGGNSVDRASRLPEDADLDRLFAFARAEGVKVIYSVRLMNGEPAPAARLAKYIHEHYADALECFAVGNEPQYFKTYPEFREKWKAIVDAMLAAAPGSKFCGPDTNPNPEWCKKLAEEYGNSGWFVMITEHDYPGGCSYKNPFVSTNGPDVVTTPRAELIPVDAGEAREKLLSPALYARYAEVLKSMTDATAGTPLTFRLTETNTFWFGGLLDASDTYASALWCADYLYWWTAHGAQGLNFHTGDNVGAGSGSVQSKYTAFFTTDKGFNVRPLSYGMKLFDLGGHGRMIPLSIAGANAPDLSAYATLSAENKLTITLINKAHGPAAVATEVMLKVDASTMPAEARVLFLASPGGDIAAKTGVTLGGAAIEPDGSWNGRWAALKINGSAIRLSVPAASAAVVQVEVAESQTGKR